MCAIGPKRFPNRLKNIKNILSLKNKTTKSNSQKRKQIKHPTTMRTPQIFSHLIGLYRYQYYKHYNTHFSLGKHIPGIHFVVGWSCWMPGAHQSHSITALCNWTREKTKCSWVKDQERSFIDYCHNTGQKKTQFGEINWIYYEWKLEQDNED